MAFPLPIPLLFLLALALFQKATAVHPPLFNRIAPSSERTVNLTLTGDFGDGKSANGNSSSANITNLAPSTVEAKIRRLKELRNEMHALTAMIKEERRRSWLRFPSECPLDRMYKKVKQRIPDSGTIQSRIKCTPKSVRWDTILCRQFRKWRKKVLSKIHFVMHRLDHLEGEMHRTKDNLQKVMHENGREKGAAKWGGGGNKKRRPTSSHSADSLSIRRSQMHRRGELGSVCQNHGECKPGHCCLRDAPMSTVPLAIGQRTGHCVRYAFEEGVACKHSCACEAQLLCFREHQQLKANDANSSSPVAVCKRASSSDLLNGVYENALDAVFEHHKTSFSANIF